MGGGEGAEACGATRNSPVLRLSPIVRRVERPPPPVPRRRQCPPRMCGEIKRAGGYLGWSRWLGGSSQWRGREAVGDDLAGSVRESVPQVVGAAPERHKMCSICARWFMCVSQGAAAVTRGGMQPSRALGNRAQPLRAVVEANVRRMARNPNYKILYSL